MKEVKTYYRRNLPHIHSENAVFFITFRLVNSLPAAVVEKLKQEQMIEEKRLMAIKNTLKRRQELNAGRKRYIIRFDEMLDRANDSPRWLGDERIAGLVQKKIHSLDNDAYYLISHCIMPNHVHLVIDIDIVDKRKIILTKRDKSRSTITLLAKILQKIKGAMAHEANIILNRKGQFWQHESFDHVVRNGTELENIISYVLYNPVKAGLVKTPEEWKWSYSIYET
ncbi:MAG: transposase [Bacteroidota bacterium]